MQEFPLKKDWQKSKAINGLTQIGDATGTTAEERCVGGEDGAFLALWLPEAPHVAAVEEAQIVLGADNDQTQGAN